MVLTDSNQSNIAVPVGALADVLEIIQLLAMKSAQGTYIFRGEPECYYKVSSNLFRAYPRKHAEQLNIRQVQRQIIEEAKAYTGETDEFEILTHLQHYGGKTNLIDFTYDYLIALYFACDGSPEEKGRVVLLQSSGVAGNYAVRQPRNPSNRVIAQKSIFVEPFLGFVEPHDIVIVDAIIKQSLLEYLRTRHGISTHTIYNDLIGYIKVQDIHTKAYLEFHEGLSDYHKQDYDQAIEHYSRAIRFNPQMVNAYNNRGLAYHNKQEFDRAIQDFDKAVAIDPNHPGAYGNRGNAYLAKKDYDLAIQEYNQALLLGPSTARGALNNLGNAYDEKGDFRRATEYYTRVIMLDPNNAGVYYNRGLSWLCMAEWGKAKSDLTNAFVKGFDVASNFRLGYGSVKSFEEKYVVELPQEIMDMFE